jgi:hypothetical protein
VDPFSIITFAIGLIAGLVPFFYSEKKRREAEAAGRARELEEDAGRRQMTEQLGLVLAAVGAPATTGPKEAPLDATEDRPFAVTLADINNDGRDELLVASPWGPHSSMLRVFGLSDDEPMSFGLLMELSSGTPAGFTVGDLDGDGAIEVATIQPSEDHPYAVGIRDEVLYRWNGTELAELATRRLPAPGKPDAPMQWHTGWSVLSVHDAVA